MLFSPRALSPYFHLLFLQILASVPVGLQDLPAELFPGIARYLSFNETLRFSSVSKRVPRNWLISSSISKSDEFDPWKRKNHYKFGQLYPRAFQTFLNRHNTSSPRILEKAAKDGRLELVLHAIQKGIDPSANDNSAFRWASRMGHSEVVASLLKDDRVYVGSFDNEAIRMASLNGHDKVVELLLRDGRANPSEMNSESIRMASENGHVKVVELLLKDGRADLRAESDFAIRRASIMGHVHVVEMLLKDNRTDPGAINDYAIRYASCNGHVKVVELLLQDNM